MKLSIGFVNDVHGYVEQHNELFYTGGEEIIQKAGGYDRIATLFKDIKRGNSNSLFFDGGDTFHGTLPLIESKGEALIPILKKLDFSAMVGHWDFAYGPEQLKHLMSQLNYPLLGINIYNHNGTLFTTPYIIKEINSTKIGIIGICSNIIDKTMPKHFSEGIEITDGSKELPFYIENLRNQGVNIIILLSHNGFPQDVELLNNTTGVDICLSAHTHNRLYEPVKVKDTILIQCGCHGSFVGKLEVNITENKITGHNYKLICVSESMVPDEEIKSMVEMIMKPYNRLKVEKIGNTKRILHRYSTMESTMDNLLLSSIKFISKSDIAFSNGWRYGCPVNVGEISKWNLYNIIPMNPVISTVDMTGKEIITMLEENLERTFSSMPMNQMGGYVKRSMGIHVKMRIENPAFNRIQEVYFNREHLQMDKIYKVSFVTSQGVPEKYGSHRTDLEIKAVEAMEIYLKENNPYDPEIVDSFNLI